MLLIPAVIFHKDRAREHLVVSDVISLFLSGEIIKEYFVQNQIDYRKIISVKKNILFKLVNLIYILDYTTIYLAALNRVDPSPVNSIDFIKDKEVERRVAK